MNNTRNYGRFRASITPHQLRDLYAEHTDPEIATMFGVTGALVGRYRAQWGIPTMTGRERRDKLRQEQGLPTLDDLTPVELSALYSKMGDRQIAAMHGVTKPTILKLRQKWGIAPISKSERATSKGALTDDQMEALMGILMGDGHVLPRGVFQVAHSHAQVGYLQHIHGLLASIARPIAYSERVMDSGTLTYEFRFRTVQHTWLQQLRKVFYPDGTKVFPEGVLRNLSPRSLAYWYFDDGHLDSGLPSLALGDIPPKMAENVACWLQERFALAAYVRPQSTESCQQIGIRAKTTDIFFSLIMPFVLPEMHHKMPPKFRPTGQAPRRPALTREPSALPKHLIDNSRVWGSLPDGEQAQVLEELTAFWTDAGFPHPVARVEELDILHALSYDQVVRDGGLRGLGVGQSLCHAMMPHIWHTGVHGAKYTPMELFEDREMLRRAIKMVLGFGEIPHPSRIRSAMRMFRYSGVYNFRPSAAKVLADRYCTPGGTVFDPCGGWGGRMVGVLMSSSRPHYTACEPQRDTHAALGQLHGWIARYIPEVEGKAEIHRVPAEDFAFPQGVDMVLTSPPYWCKEHYGEDPELAGNRYPTYESWLAGFWEPVMRKSVEALRPGGWLILNVDDVTINKQFYPLANDTLEIAEALGLGQPVENLRYEMGRPGRRENHELVFCWAKGLGVIVQDTPPSLATTRCPTCGQALVSGETMCSRCCQAENSTVECEECHKPFVAKRKTAQFCSDTCGARSRRRRNREVNPPKATREFLCVGCGETFETEKAGRFRWCPECREKRDVASRTRVCGYRECGREFVDTSTKGSMRYCCPEHRRREKLFRSGEVSDVAMFRKPDPMRGQPTG